MKTKLRLSVVTFIGILLLMGYSLYSQQMAENEMALAAGEVDYYIEDDSFECVNSIISVNSQLVRGFNEVVILLNDPSLTDEWKTKMNEEIKTIEDAIVYSDSIVPTENTKDIYASHSLAMTEYKNALVWIKHGVENYDLASFSIAIGHIEEAVWHLDSILILLEPAEGELS